MKDKLTCKDCPKFRAEIRVKPLKDARAAIAEPSRNRDDLEVCSDYDESDESKREDREAYEVDKADAKRKGEW